MKKGCGLVPARLQPLDRLAGCDHRARPLQATDLLAIPNKVLWIQMIGRCIILSREPVVVAVIARLGLLIRVEFTVQMPFARVTSLIALLLQKGRNRDLTGPKMILRTAWNPSPNAIAVRSPAGQDGGPGGGADAARRVALSEPNSLAGETVQVG